MLPGDSRHFERDGRPLRHHHPVEPAGDITDRRRQDTATPAAPVVNDAALHPRQRSADGLLRKGALMMPRPPGQMAHAGLRHEGDGEMCPNPPLGSVSVGLTFRSCLVTRKVGKVGHHPVQPVRVGNADCLTPRKVRQGHQWTRAVRSPGLGTVATLRIRR